MEREKVRYSGIRPHSGLKDRTRVRFGHERFFWTQERRDLAQQIVEAINSELGEFGCPAYRFRREDVRLVKLEDENPGFVDLYTTRSINLGLNYVKRSETHFAYAFTQGVLNQHVYLEVFKGKEIILRRRGVEIGGEGRSFYGRELTRAVVKKTAIEILERYFPGKFFSYVYPKLAPWDILIEDICRRISENNSSSYPTPKDAFRLFQQATFGRGYLPPLTRALCEVYGPGSLKRLLRKDTPVLDFF